MSSVIYKQSFKSRTKFSTPGLNVRHLQYIATRPGVVPNKGCGFGLWGRLPGQDAIRVQNDFVAAKQTVRDASAEHTLYRAIISVGKEDAENYGLYDRGRWEQMINSHIDDIAKEMDIRSGNLCWLAAMHKTQGHPHVHLLYWDNSNQPRPEYMKKTEFEKKAERIRGIFAGDIHRDEIRTNQQTQAAQAKMLRTSIQAMCLDANPERILNFPKLCQSTWLDRASVDMAELIRQLPAKGSLRYAYLPADYKALVDRFVNHCLERPDFAEELANYQATTNKISELYANSEETAIRNADKAMQKLRKELGNQVMDAIRNIHAEIGAPPRNSPKTNTALQETISKVVPTLSSYQKLLSLLPQERIPLESMEQQIPEYRQQLEQVAIEVMSDFRIQQHLPMHVSTTNEKTADSSPELDTPEIDHCHSITEHEWDTYQSIFIDEIQKVYLQSLETQKPSISIPVHSSDSHRSRYSKKDDNWWTEEYKEARRNLYGSKDYSPDFPRAFTQMQAEANTGNGFAMHDLAKMYLSGLGCEKDESTAQKWFQHTYQAFISKEAVDKKKDYLQYRIGKLYSFGFGVEQDYAQAAEWYEKAVDAGNPFAAYSLANLYNHGQGVEQDYVSAYELYRIAAEHPNTPNAYAAYELGRMCQDGIGTVQDKTVADTWFRRAYNGFQKIEKNIADDKLYYRLGQMNLNGIGTEKNMTQAKLYFEKAAALGNHDAFYGLGKLYLCEDFDEYSPSKAVGFFAEAADRGNNHAQYTLGKLFLRGEVVPKDIDCALRWLEEAVANGNEYAQYLLGKTLLMGEDVTRDIHRAEELLTQAAEKGNDHAQYTLGKAYLQGDLLPQNIPEAMRLLTEAANNGNDHAQYTLGNLFLRGEIVPKDIDCALRWLEEAVANNNEHAQYLLGKTLLMGEDVTRDIHRAEELLTQAAEKGNDHAQYTLGKAYLRGELLPQNIPEAMRLLTEAANNGNEYAEKLIAQQLREDAGWTSEAIRTGTAMTVCSLMSIISRMVNQRQAMYSLAAARKLFSKDKSQEAKREEQKKHEFESEWDEF